MRYNLYKRKQENIYEYIKCKIINEHEEDYTKLFGEDYKEEDNIIIENENNLAFPILDDDTKELREMTREEKIILLGDTVLLTNGEKFVDGKIVQVKDPSTKYLKYNWNRETLEWECITTKDELVKIRSEKVRRVQELKRDISDYEAFGDCEDEIKMAQDEINILMPEIKELAELINLMKIA